ncbi:MAG TPA: LCP family protein [Candidatus Saccharibacteria bacterium]|nr:LCP family protein [Candidatus Saccharibacteria bacterium]
MIDKNSSRKSRRAITTDGFVRRKPGNNIISPQSAPKKSISSYMPSIGSKDQFRQKDGMNVGPLSRSNKFPDGTSTGRKPIFKKDLDMDIESGKRKKHRLFSKPKGFKGYAKRGVLGALALFMLVGLSILGLLYWRARQVFDGGDSALALSCDVNPSLLQKEGDGRVNVLLLGKGGPGHDGPDLTDTILIASVDSCQREVGLLSIPRDLYVQRPGNGYTKINNVYPQAKEEALALGKSKKEAEKIGIEAIEKVAGQVTGMPIHYYTMVDFKAFQKAIDTVGGIDVNVKEPLYDPSVAWENNWDPLIADKGVQHFNGKKALLFSRSRFGSARGDFDRTERQRQVMVALKEKALSLGTFSNPIKITGLLNAFGSHVHTNLSIDDILKLYEIGKDVGEDKVISVGLADPPNEFVTTDTIDGLSVVVPKAGIDNYGEIHKYLRTKLRDGFLKKENAGIVVLNGTSDAGLAKKYANNLKSYGYKIVSTGDAPNKGSAGIQLIDLRNGDNKYTKRYLELRTKTTAINKLPEGVSVDPEKTDFVIIVGKE